MGTAGAVPCGRGGLIPGGWLCSHHSKLPPASCVYLVISVFGTLIRQGCHVNRRADRYHSLFAYLYGTRHIYRQDTIYGDQSEDSGGEVRFSVELTEISGLKSTYSLDIRRLKGPLRSYKYMYDSLRE
jgi:hypothetical protein